MWNLWITMNQIVVLQLNPGLLPWKLNTWGRCWWEGRKFTRRLASREDGSTPVLKNPSSPLVKPVIPIGSWWAFRRGNFSRGVQMWGFSWKREAGGRGRGLKRVMWLLPRFTPFVLMLSLNLDQYSSIFQTPLVYNYNENYSTGLMIHFHLLQKT